MARGRHSAYFGRTKGHSILPQRSYGLLGSSSLPSRHYNLDEDYPPITYRAPINFHHGADYYAANAMANHATHLSTDTVYDNIDLAEKSRGKDKRLMSQVNAALHPESVPERSERSQGLGRVARAASQRLLQRYYPEAAHDCQPKMSLRELETLHLGRLPEYRKPIIPAVYKSPRLVFDEPERRLGGGGSLRQWLADGLTKTRTMFRKDGKGTSEFRWLDSPSVGELDSPSDFSDPYESPYSSYEPPYSSYEPPYSSYDYASSIGSEIKSPDTTYLYDSVEPDEDIAGDIYYTPTDLTENYTRRGTTPRPLHSVKQLRRRRRRRERNRTPSFQSRSPLLDNISEVGSNFSVDSRDTDFLDDYPLSLESINRQTRFLPYEPAPPYPTTKLYSDFGTSLSSPSLNVTPYTPSIPEFSSNRVTPSAILFNSIVSAARRRALSNIPDFSNLDTSNVIFSIETPLSHRPTTYVPPKLEFELPVSYRLPYSSRSYPRITPIGDEIVSFRPSEPSLVETNRRALDLSKPVVVSLEGGDDFFSKFLSQRKQFRDSILRRLDDGSENTRAVVPLRYTSSYNTAPYRAIVTSRRTCSPEPTRRDRDRRRLNTHDELPSLPSLSRPTYPIRAVVSVEPLPPRYSSYDRTRPREIEDDSMSLVPVSRANHSRMYSCERDNDEPTGTLTTLDRIRLKAYATPSTPARARASRRANRQQDKSYYASPLPVYSPTYNVPPQVPYLAISPDSRSVRARSLSPEYVYRRPVGGRARARASRGVSQVPDSALVEPILRGRTPIRASPVRYLPYLSYSPTREAELALSPTRLENSRSRDPYLDEPYTRGFSFAYPYRTALWARSRRSRLPLRGSKYWGYPYVGSNLSGYPFGNTKWIINPSTASTLGVNPVRAGREGVDPLSASRWFWGPSWLDYDDSPRLRNYDYNSLYNPRFDITPSEATRFGIDPSTAANWNAASPIRTGRWDMTPAEGMTWETPEESLKWNVYPLRAGSPRARSVSPLRSHSQSLSPSEAARWGITPAEASVWSCYPSSRIEALDRYVRAATLPPSRYLRARSLSPSRYSRERSLSPVAYARQRSLSPLGFRRARSLSPLEYEDYPVRSWSGYYPRARSLSPMPYEDYPVRSWSGYYPRRRSVSPSYRYGVDPPYSVPRFAYPLGRPRDVSPLKFSPLPLRTRSPYSYASFAKKAIVPSKASKRMAARRFPYLPAPRRSPVVVVYVPQNGPRSGRRAYSAERQSRVSPDTVREMLRRYEPRKPYDSEYSGKLAAARAITRSMAVIPQGIDFQAAIIAPSVEIETKRKTKGPKSKYAANVMRELRLNPKEDLDYQPHYQAAVNRDRYDRFHLRPSATANRVYASGSLASKATPRPSSGKTIRQVEGYSKPKNLLSWQYRIDSYSDPSDVFYTPASVYKMKDRVRDVQERLDLHRQMLDRYLQVDLGPDDDVSSRIARKHRDVESRQHEIEVYKCDIREPKILTPKEPPFRIYLPKSEGGAGSSGGSGGQTSALRQRLRKVLCKSHDDPAYFKE